MQSIENKVISSIYGHGRGWAFTAHDFSREFKRANIDVALSKLAQKGEIRRVCRGVYDYPQYSELLKQTLSPDYDLVAQAIARKFNWRIQASGDAALNLLGLSTQVPGRLLYLSDGPTRNYRFAKITLHFKKTALKEIGFKYRESGLVVQAIKALGKQRIDEAVIKKVRRQLDPKKRRQVLHDTATVTSWVYEVIKLICKEES